MRKVWAVSDSIVSPLGNGTHENYERVRKGESAIADYTLPGLNEVLKAGVIPHVAMIDGLTRFESMCALAVSKALESTKLDPDRTLFILSTTKGNIDLIEDGNGSREGMSLHSTADLLGGRFGFQHTLVVSNACISGLLAIVVGKRFITSGKYDHAIILGADIVSPFVITGFKSLLALSSELCKPFDAGRCGINLGEAAAAMVLTCDPAEVKGVHKVLLSGEGLTNDANHISGPSRTGEELAMAIGSAIGKSGSKRAEIDFVSAHGTATVFNDEMEAKAFFLAGLEGVPVNSLKSYYGHTLGAAGVVESIISIQSLIRNEIIGTLGFKTRGVSMPVKIASKTQSLPLKRILKTASGFGGCNAALVFEKVS